MKKLRANIDVLDASLDLLGKEMKVADEIGLVKTNVAVLQNKRWNEILGKMILEGEKKGLTEEFVLRMFKNPSREYRSSRQSA
jgi:chorismate mutase